MPTIADSLYFNYDGQSSKDFGLVNANITKTRSTGLLTMADPFSASITINETAVKGSDAPLFDSIDEAPISFNLDLVFQSEWTDEIIDNIIVWLFQGIYKPLYFEDKPDKIYYCMPSGDSTIAHNGLKQGYVSITMRCKSSRVYSPQQLTSSVDLSTNTGTHNISITNNGHVEIYPEISFTKVNNGIITFTKDGQIFEIENLTNGEQIYIDCGRQIIQTDAVGIYHYSDVVGDFFDMILNRGSNTIGVQGTCKDLQFRYIFKYRF